MAATGRPEGTAVNETQNLRRTQPLRIAEGVPEQRRPADRAGRRTAAPPRESPRPDEKSPSDGVLRASFTVVRVRSGSVFRLVAVVGVVLFVCWMIGVVAAYVVLARMGAVDRLNNTLAELLKGSGHDVGNLVNFGTVVLVGAVTGLLNVVLVAAFVGACAQVYNSCSELTGGLELTLAESRSVTRRSRGTRRD
jgi:hypothetical protein